MKIILRNLIVMALFLLPICGLSASTPVQTAEASGSNNAGVLGTTPPAAPAFETQSPAVPGAEAQESNPSFPVFRTIGSLGLVLCLMVGGYFAAKKFAPRYFSKGTSDRNLKVIETLSMGDKRSISMIEVGNSRFLVGNTPHQINLLAALPESFSIVSEPEKVSASQKEMAGNESIQPFRNLFEVEKRRTTQYAGNPLPEDIRLKMRQLRASLER
jgi:flagellar biosynthetic protein FliO